MSVLPGAPRTVTCHHLSMIRPVAPRTPQGCEECLRTGLRWVHLRLCLSCGHVIVRSFEPGEDWRWCFVDETFV
jgi:hypothetical protein